MRSGSTTRRRGSSKYRESRTRGHRKCVKKKKATKMASEAAALLDQLMGANRDANPEERPKDKNWRDEDVRSQRRQWLWSVDLFLSVLLQVCKHFLCGFCPSELFTNTKSDVGKVTFLFPPSFRNCWRRSDCMCFASVGPCHKVHDEKLKKA